MTIDELIARLPRDGWRLVQSTIRRRVECECPLAFVANRECSPDSLVGGYRGTHLLGMTWQDAIEVIDAADNATGHDPALRARLLAACGLSPPDQPQ